MKSKILTAFTTIALLAVLAIPVQLAAQDNQQHQHKFHHYQFIDLGTFGGPQSRNDGIEPALTNGGTVIGMADTSTPEPFYPNFNPLILPGGASDPYIFRAFQWQDGQLVHLGSLPGGFSAFPSGISKNGLISGNAINGALDPITGWPEENAVFWQDGQITNLGTLGGYESGAGMVNSHGQVTGFSGNAIPDPSSLFGLGTQTRAFLWDRRNGMQDLGTLGGPDAVAPFINERGQIAGFSYTSDRTAMSERKLEPAIAARKHALAMMWSRWREWIDFEAFKQRHLEMAFEDRLNVLSDGIGMLYGEYLITHLDEFRTLEVELFEKYRAEQEQKKNSGQP